MLLVVFAAALVVTYLPQYRASLWQRPLKVEIYPINGDNTVATENYIAGLRPEHFAPVADFIGSEARRYGKTVSPALRIYLARQLRARPPETPAAGHDVFDVIGWSLRLRYWAFRHSTPHRSLSPKVRIFVQYYTNAEGGALKHSLGLREGLIGVVHAFARREQDEQNNVVIAHELLHTLGASDKYDAHTLPVFPHGYAEPAREPLYPQTHAEIMGGRIPVAPDRAAMPVGLVQCVIGEDTAREINWIK